MVKHLPAMQETYVLSLGQEDALEKDMITHSSILAWKIPQTEEPGGLQSMGSPRIRDDLETACVFHQRKKDEQTSSMFPMFLDFNRTKSKT